MIKRVIDIAGSLTGLLLLGPVLLLVAAAVRLTSPGPAIFWSQRSGMKSRPFLMPKFRSMRTEAPQVATHLLDGQSYMTPIGGFLRRSSLDEIPQLWSVLCGEMSLVGPRPALFNQHDLITARREAGIDVLRPGITGWAQVNGRDDLSTEEKVRFDLEYLQRKSLRFDVMIILLTLRHAATGRGVKH